MHIYYDTILLSMNEKIPVLYCKLKKYERKSKKKSKDGTENFNRRYMIPVKKDQIEGTRFQEVEDIVILGREDYEYELQKSKVMEIGREKLKLSLHDKKNEIINLKEQLEEKNTVNLEEYKANLESKFKDMASQYDTEIKMLQKTIEDLKKDYSDVKNHNKEREREVKRLENLRTLEKESLRIKNNEIQLNKDEYNKLKKSHELLWDVVEQKDKKIKDLEKRNLVSNLIGKIKK